MKSVIAINTNEYLLKNLYRVLECQQQTNLRDKFWQKVNKEIMKKNWCLPNKTIGFYHALESNEIKHLMEVLK